MCDPVSAGIALAVGAGTSLYGGMQQAKAADRAAQAVADQNRATQIAQNEAFQTRNQAQVQQVADQLAAQRTGLEGRTQAAEQYRTMQRDALQQYRDAINAQNQTAESLRQTGDTASQQLLEASSADQLQAAQERRRQQAAAYLDESQNMPGNPETVSPTADPVTAGALKARLARAATNIRDYGAKIAQKESYAAPGAQIGLNVADTAYGIMPARVAEQLLQGGSATRLLPTKLAYQGATAEGNTQDELIRARTQDALQAAGLTAGNAIDIANLTQSNKQTTAANIAAQEKANAEGQKVQGAMISSLGQLAMYGAGYFGGFGPQPGAVTSTNLGSWSARPSPGLLTSVGNTISSVFK